MPLHNVGSACLPYCLKLQECGRYALLNREYKPLGFVSRDFIKYNSFPILLTLRITPRKASLLSYSGSKDTSCIMLYSDGCNPYLSYEYWKSYEDKLRVLFELETPEGIDCYCEHKAQKVRQLNLRDASKYNSFPPSSTFRTAGVARAHID